MSTFVPNTTKTVLVPVSQKIDFNTLIGQAVATYGLEVTTNRVIGLNHEASLKIEIYGEPEHVGDFAQMLNDGKYNV